MSLSVCCQCFVCVFVSPCPRNHTLDLHQIFMRVIATWLGPPLVELQYVIMYFQFCDRHMFAHNDQEWATQKAHTQSDSTGGRTGLTTWCILKLTHRGQDRPEAESDAVKRNKFRLVNCEPVISYQYYHGPQMFVFCPMAPFCTLLRI